MADLSGTLVGRLLPVLDLSPHDTAAVALHLEGYLEARQALRDLPLGPRQNALVMAPGGLK
jgi:hypothetical protein